MESQGEAVVPTTMYDLADQNQQNHHNSTASTPVVEISGITGYRLLGLLLAIAGLVKTALSVKGMSAAPNKMDLIVSGVFGIIYLCLGWAESPTRKFWHLFFRIDLSPVMLRGGKIVGRCTVTLALFLFASLHAFIYLSLFCWPMSIPFIIHTRDPSLGNPKIFRFIGLLLVSAALECLQIIAYFSIMDWLDRSTFSLGKRCINYIGRYVKFSVEPLNGPVAPYFFCLLGILLISGPLVWHRLHDLPPPTTG